MTDTKPGEARTGSQLLARTPRGEKVEITPSPSDYPRSSAANYARPAPVTSEENLLIALKHEWRSSGHNDPATEKPRPRKELIIADLVDFEIYRCPKADYKRSSELTSLHLFDVKAKNLCFDGYVKLSSNKHYVERIAIDDLSIEGYGSDSNPGIIAYLQTTLSRRDATSDVWLRLRRPAPRYERFFLPFRWIAVLGKHVIDYLDDQPRSSVGLENFSKRFNRWLRQRFGLNKKFRKWLTASNNTTDFRVAFHAYAEFFYNQALNLSTARHLTSHPVWSHCMCGRMIAVARQPNLVKITLATPHVYHSFQRMYFASRLKRVAPSKPIRRMQKNRKLALGFAEECKAPQASNRSGRGDTTISSLRVGDVVSIVPDSIDKTRWRESGDEWMAYVQGIESAAKATQRLILLWLYRPADTNICLASYSVTNELFLSDNCNCKERAILSTDVIRRHTVEWSPRCLNSNSEFVIRQTYMTGDSAFVTVKDDHKVCSCRKPKADSQWSAGDTVYVSKTTDGQKLLEPVVIHEINHATGETKVRTLLRLERDCAPLARQARRSRIRPNELVLTRRLKSMSLSRYQRACHVRFIPHADVLEDQIPSPYNLAGAGDYWFVSMGLETVNNVERLVILEKLPKGFHEAREPTLTCKKLRGLSLFSGGGGLDRGLEEGGAVEFQTSVDYDVAAIHTQRANCKDPQNMRLFCGSVDDYLKSFLSGDINSLVARVGEVDLIAAGSPCPGFSSLQQNMLSDQSLTYASHITTFCTAVDLYRPLYGVLENVVNMASTRTGFEEQNILSQLVACLVSMGYQVNQYIMDSWTYGSCQRRSRIILTIAAPGLEPILQRPHSHSRSYEDTHARSLGLLPNGERFGDREHYATPFPHVTAKEATSDLPGIGNGSVQACISFPDHRLSRPTTGRIRALIECVPRCPSGSGYAEAMQQGLVPPLLCMTKKETGRAYRRIKADGLIPTITTNINMQDARNGASVHWSQHRPLSIHEARRTQGYPDNEPIIGTLNEQWKILGNGVDRKVSFAIGLALRDALARSKSIPLLSEDPEDGAEMVVDADEDMKDDWNMNEHQQLGLMLASPSSLSSSTESFSSMQGSQQRLALSVALDGALDVKSHPDAQNRAFLHEVSGLGRSVLEQPLVPNESFLYRFSRQVTKNMGTLTLASIPSFLHSAQPGTPTKRSREEVDDEAQKVFKTDAGPVKRAKVLAARRTASPAVQVTESEISLPIRRASLSLLETSAPPETATHTRSSGPARFAPKEWHKQIGDSNNVIELE